MCPALPSPVTALSFDLADAHLIPEHLHPEDQLVYACRGVMTVKTREGTWVVPAQRAVWIPAKTPHSIVISGAVSMRTVYFRARLVRGLPRECRVVNVSALLRGLILQACRLPSLSRRQKSQAPLIDLLIDQLETVEAIPLQLSRPTDSRALKAAELMAKDPSNYYPTERLCSEAGAAREPSRDSSAKKLESPWASGGSRCDYCIRLSFLQPEKRSRTPPWRPVTARPARSLPCSRRRWE